MDDNRIAFKEVNSKKQTRIPDEVIEELEIDVHDENMNGIGFYQNDVPGEIVIKRLDF